MSDVITPAPSRRLYALGPILVAITVGYGLAVLVQPGHWRPMSYVNPQVVGADTVRAGWPIRVIGTKCNNTHDAIAVRGSTYLVLMDPRTPRLLAKSEAIRSPGCTTSNWDNPIPIDTPPGEYRLEGIEIAEDGANVQRGAWYSESFEVVAP